MYTQPFFCLFCYFFLLPSDLVSLGSDTSSTIVDLYVFVETTIETHRILRKWAFAYWFSSLRRAFPLIRCTCYIPHEFIIIIISHWHFLFVGFVPSSSSCFVIFVVYSIYQGERESERMWWMVDAERMNMKRKKTVLYSIKLAAVCYIYIRSTYLFFVLLACFTS